MCGLINKLEKWKDLSENLTEFSEDRNKWCEL